MLPTLEEEYNHRRKNYHDHFFDKETMKFFSSRIYHSTAKEKYANIYFITSEKACFNDATRVYNIRCMKADGDIDTIAKRPTLAEAKAALNDIIDNI